MSEDKVYSVNEIRRIRELCRMFDVEPFTIDVICEGLDIDEARRRLTTIDEELKHKSYAK